MKKKLEAELISIAHRILKLKNKSELIQLHQETLKLYEKLSILRFVEENFAEAKPTIGQTEIEQKLEAAFEVPAAANETESAEKQNEAEVIPEPKEAEKENQTAVEPEMVTESKPADEDISEKTQALAPKAEPAEIFTDLAAEENTEVPAAVAEETEIPVSDAEKTIKEEEQTVPVSAESPKEDSFFKPAFELSFDPKSDDSKETVKEDAKDEFKSANEQITFEDILGSSYIDPIFVKADDVVRHNDPVQPDNVIPIGRSFSDNSNVISMNKTDNDKSFSLNDRLSKGITIGLNDRVAFMKHLFANSSEDYNRVLSQLITFDTFAEAQYFIDNMVRPDYNNWEGKDEYAARFMEIVEKKFS